jgi:hypothetical protein
MLIFSIVLAVVVIFFGGWALTYPDSNDPKNLRYVRATRWSVPTPTFISARDPLPAFPREGHFSVASSGCETDYMGALNVMSGTENLEARCVVARKIVVLP